MAYHIFHTAKDFWKQVKIYKSEGYTWIQESHPDYDPAVNDSHMPVILNVDNNKTMMFGLINGLWKDRYFKDPEFVKLYNQSLRKLKLKKIENE